MILYIKYIFLWIKSRIMKTDIMKMDIKKTDLKKRIKTKRSQKMNEMRIYEAIKKITDIPFNQGESFEIKIPQNISIDDIQWDLQMSKKPEPQLEEYGYIPNLKKYEKYYYRRYKGELSKEFEEINELNPYYYMDVIEKKKIENKIIKITYNTNLLFFQDMSIKKKEFEELINHYFDENKYVYFNLYNFFSNNTNLNNKKDINYLRITNLKRKSINNFYLQNKSFSILNKNIYYFEKFNIQNEYQYKKIYNVNSILNLFKEQYHKMDIIHINLNAYFNNLLNINKKYYSISIYLIHILYLVSLYQSKGGSFTLITEIFSNKVFSDIIYLFSILYEKLIIEKNIRLYYTNSNISFTFHSFKGITSENLEKIKDICIQIEKNREDGYVDISQIITNHNPFESEFQKIFYYFQKKLIDDIKNKLYILQTFKKINQINKIKYEKIIIKKQIQFLIYLLQYLESLDKKYKIIK